MKINDTTGKLAPAAQKIERPAASATPEAGAAGTARAPSEQVSLSGSARALLGAQSDMPVNTDKVAEIRQQIADGSYHVDAARIADSLITATRELFAPRH